jgi:hypothetical protein
MVAFIATAVRTSNLAFFNGVPTYFMCSLPVKWIPQELQFFQCLGDQILRKVKNVMFLAKYFSLLPSALD